MKKTLCFILTVILLLAALPCGATAQEQPYTLRVLTFEDADYNGSGNMLGEYGWSSLIDDPQYGGSLLYGDGGFGYMDEASAYQWNDEGNTGLYSVMPECNGSWCFWSGAHAISNYNSGNTASYGGFGSQLTVYKAGVDDLETTGGGHNGSDNFAIHFGYKDGSPYNTIENLPFVAFPDGEEHVLDSMYVNNTCYAIACYMDGNGLTAKIGPNDWVKLVATGYAADGTVVLVQPEFYLCNGPDNIVTDWAKWDLSAMGKVNRVEFNITGSSDNGYGFSQPAYFAYDDLAVRFNVQSDCTHETTEKEFRDIGDGKFQTVDVCTACGVDVTVTLRLVGDVNLDDKLNSNDYSSILSHISSGMILRDPVKLYAADVNADGLVNAVDYVVLQKFVGGELGEAVLPVGTTTRIVYKGSGKHVETYFYGEILLTNVAIPEYCTMDGGRVTAEATCTGNGEKTFTCTVCGNERKETIPAVGHSYTSAVTAPTCTESGFTTYTCGACGDSYTSDETNALDHNWDDGSVTKKATCTTDGVTTYVCAHDSAHTKEEPIPATGHTFDEWRQTKMPTEYVEGEAARTCAVCGETETHPLAKLPSTELLITEKPAQNMTYKTTFALKASEAVTWTSDNEKVAAVDPQTGELTATGKGTATITAHSVQGEKTVSFTATVRYTWWQQLIRIFLFGFLWY